MQWDIKHPILSAGSFSRYFQNTKGQLWRCFIKVTNT